MNRPPTPLVGLAAAGLNNQVQAMNANDQERASHDGIQAERLRLVHWLRRR